MSDLISRQAVYEMLHGLGGCDATDEWADGWDKGINQAISDLDDIPATHDVDKVVDNELRLLKNYIDNMPKVYRKRNANWVIVQDLLMAGTSHAGRTSSIKKCFELGIDAYDYNLIVKGGE